MSDPTQAAREAAERMVAAYELLRDKPLTRAALIADFLAFRETGRQAALEDPTHEEYQQVVDMVAGLAESEPMPKREIPLAFIMCFCQIRRLASPAPKEEG